MIYLDHAATSPLRPEVLEAMLPWLGPPSNPASAHAAGRAARRALEEARARIAAALGRPADGLVFTSGATEANLLAVRAAAAVGAARWTRTALEHPSMVAAAGAAATVLGCGADGQTAVPEGRLDAGDALAVIAVQHETGVVQPLDRVGATGAGWVHVDAVQAVGRVALPAVASCTVSAHKLGGPVGVAALSLEGRRALDPLIPGPQERARRGGTPPVALAVGMAAAVEAAVGAQGAEAARLAALRDRLQVGLRAWGARVPGAGAPRSPATLATVFPGLAGEEVVIALDLAGVAVSAGAACASGAAGPSPALAAMGDPEPRGLVRWSLGWSTRAEDIDGALAAAARALAHLRAS